MPSKFFKYFAVLIVFFITSSLMTRLVIWNGTIAWIDNNSEFWRSWYMKIYYPTHTRLDGLGTGVLIGYFMQYSAGFKKQFIRMVTNFLFQESSCWVLHSGFVMNRFQKVRPYWGLLWWQ
jgi:uncharacterized membrane protein